MSRLLKPEPLTEEAFAPYGDVIECSDRAEQRHINYGHTIRFHDLARLDLNAAQGKPIVSIFRSTPMDRPVPIKIMERHPLSSQAFYPLSDRPFLVVVAEKGDFNPDALKAFLANPTQGVNYHAGTWHHYSLALDDVSDFLVIDRGNIDDSDPEENCDEISLENLEPIHVNY
jgi:ureidoglycolate lyase